MLVKDIVDRTAGCRKVTKKVGEIDLVGSLEGRDRCMTEPKFGSDLGAKPDWADLEF